MSFCSLLDGVCLSGNKRITYLLTYLLILSMPTLAWVDKQTRCDSSPFICTTKRNRLRSIWQTVASQSQTSPVVSVDAQHTIASWTYRVIPHTWPSGILCRRNHRLELASRWALRSELYWRNFSTITETLAHRDVRLFAPYKYFYLLT